MSRVKVYKEYDSIDDRTDGYTNVLKNDKWGLLKDGVEVVPCKFYRVREVYHDRYAIVYDKYCYSSLYDIKNNRLIKSSRSNKIEHCDNDIFFLRDEVTSVMDASSENIIIGPVNEIDYRIKFMVRDKVIYLNDRKGKKHSLYNLKGEVLVDKKDCMDSFSADNIYVIFEGDSLNFYDVSINDYIFDWVETNGTSYKLKEDFIVVEGYDILQIYNLKSKKTVVLYGDLKIVDLLDGKFIVDDIDNSICYIVSNDDYEVLEDVDYVSPKGTIVQYESNKVTLNFERNKSKRTYQCECKLEDELYLLRIDECHAIYQVDKAMRFIYDMEECFCIANGINNLYLVGTNEGCNLYDKNTGDFISEEYFDSIEFLSDMFADDTEFKCGKEFSYRINQMLLLIKDKEETSDYYIYDNITKEMRFLTSSIIEKAVGKYIIVNENYYYNKSDSYRVLDPISGLDIFNKSFCEYDRRDGRIYMSSDDSDMGLSFDPYFDFANNAKKPHKDGIGKVVEVEVDDRQLHYMPYDNGLYFENDDVYENYKLKLDKGNK